MHIHTCVYFDICMHSSINAYIYRYYKATREMLQQPDGIQKTHQSILIFSHGTRAASQLVLRGHGIALCPKKTSRILAPAPGQPGRLERGLATDICTGVVAPQGRRFLQRPVQYVRTGSSPVQCCCYVLTARARFPQTINFTVVPLRMLRPHTCILREWFH